MVEVTESSLLTIPPSGQEHMGTVSHDRDPVVAMHQEVLNASLTQLGDALLLVRTGRAEETELAEASASLAQMGNSLERYITSRTDEIAQAEGSGPVALSGVVSEVIGTVQELYTGVQERVGDSSEVQGVIEKMRVSKLGRKAGAIALTAAAGASAWIASKGMDIGIDALSNVGVGVGAAVAGVVGKGVLSKPVGKLAKNVTSKFKDRLIASADKPHLAQIKQLEQQMGRELSSEEKADELYRLRSVSDTEALGEDLYAIIGKHHVHGEPLDSATVGNIFSTVAVEHIASLFGLSTEAQRLTSPGSGRKFAAEAISRGVLGSNEFGRSVAEEVLGAA